MISFLDMEKETALYKFVRCDLSEKYQMKIDIEEAEIVVGLAGLDERVVEAFIVRFFPDEAKEEWIENRIRESVHRFCYDNEIMAQASIVIERDVYLGRIRYGLVYTEI